MYSNTAMILIFNIIIFFMKTKTKGENVKIYAN